MGISKTALSHLKMHIELKFDCFNVSAMVKNLCIDANILTLCAFLSEIEPFYWCIFLPSGHIGRHFGRHFEFTGHNSTIHVFWLFQVVDQGQKHTPRCYYFYSRCIFKWDRAILLMPILTRRPSWSPFWSPFWIYGSQFHYTCIFTVSRGWPESKTYP